MASAPPRDAVHISSAASTTERSPGLKVSDGRLLELDVFRGIAALVVVIYHYTQRYHELFRHPELPPFRLTLGYLGVELFFMISGFVIFMTVLRCKVPADFVVSRFSRIFPPFWFAVILTATVLAIAPLPGLEVTITQVFLNFTLMHKPFVPHVDGVYWTLTVELCFYALVCLAFACGALDKIRLFCWVWLIAGAITVATGLAEVDVWVGRIIGYLVLTYGQLFVAGIAFYIVRRDGWSFGPLSLIIGSYAVNFLRYDLVEMAFITVFYAAFIGFVSGWLKWIALRPLVFLGTISYSLYLTHQNIGYRIMKSLYEGGFDFWISTGTALAVALTIASAMTYFIERPSLKLIRSLYRRFRTIRTG
ncbi:MAG: acyltransferase [Pseudomonadota bacterium]